jgi:tetratricopeptide (TPR) repeat protein
MYMKKIIMVLIVFAVLIGAYFYMSSRPAENVVVAEPSLEKEFVMPANMEPTQAEAIRKSVDELVALLRNNKDDANAWMQLALYRKASNDLEGAKEIWEYVAYIRPSNFVPLNNLGDLYGYYLKDSVKAEKYFLKALEIGKTEVAIYQNVALFYRDVMKDNAKAKSVLQKGIDLKLDTSNTLNTLLETLK